VFDNGKTFNPSAIFVIEAMNFLNPALSLALLANSKLGRKFKKDQHSSLLICHVGDKATK
jgi:hypothetical protein